MKKENKEAQFYLIAVVIFVSLIIGFFTISNTYEKKTLLDIEINEKEINQEIQNIIEYGVYNGLSNEEMFSLIDDFLNNYIKLNNHIESYFLYGEKNNLSITGSNNKEAQIKNSSNDYIPLSNTQEKKYFKRPIDRGNEINENKIDLLIDNNNYLFNIDDMNFYYILVYEEDGETLYTSNKENLFN
ncbi:MAG: hypothetical protein ACOC1K_00315 [Nanoarchaeota archaeon]